MPGHLGVWNGGLGSCTRVCVLVVCLGRTATDDSQRNEGCEDRAVHRGSMVECGVYDTGFKLDWGHFTAPDRPATSPRE